MPRFYQPVEEFDDDDEFDDFLDDPDEYENVRVVQQPDDYLLYEAISNKNLNQVKSLLQKGVDVNLKLVDQWSALMLAALYGNLEIVKELVNSGADVNYCGEQYTVLMAACHCEDPTVPTSTVMEIVELLIKKGANVNAVNPKKMNALMCAAASGRVELVKMLLPLADKNSKDYLGWNALFWAISKKQIEVTGLLLEEGFSLKAVDVRNNTPYQLATMQDSEELLDLFPSVDKDKVYLYRDINKTIEEIFADLKPGEKPKFFSDICNILHGVNSDSAVRILSENNIGLSEFLVINEDRLKELGILLPFQRHRILGGLHRLHRHPFREKSVPIVKKDYSSIDVADSIVSCVKQVIVMEASIKYVLPYLTANVSKIDKKSMKVLRNQLLLLKKKVAGIKRTAKVLKSRSIELDCLSSPPDLITADSIKRRHRSNNFHKYTLTVAVLSLAVTIYVKLC